MTPARLRVTVSILLAGAAFSAASAGDQAPPPRPAETCLTAVPQLPMGAWGVLSADGRWAASAGDDHVGIWDCRHKCLRLSVALPGRHNQPVFHPKDNAVLCNCGRYSLLIAPASGEIRTVALPYGLSAFSRDGRHLAVAGPHPVERFGSHQRLHLLDAQTLRKLREWQTRAATALTLRFANDDTWLVLSGEGGNPHARIYLGYPITVTVDLTTGELTTETPVGKDKKRFPPPKYPHPPELPKVVADAVTDHNRRFPAPFDGTMWLSPDRGTLVTYLAGAIEAWDLKTGQRRRFWAPGYNVHFLGWAGRGVMHFSGYQGLVRWDPASGDVTAKRMPKALWSESRLVRMAPDGEHFLVTGGGRTRMVAWRADEPLWQRPEPVPPTHPIAWRKFDKLCFFEGRGGRVQLVEADTGKVRFSNSVTRDDQENIRDMVAYTLSGSTYLLLAIGDADRGRVVRCHARADRIRHQGVIFDKIGTLPTSVAFATTGSIYAGDYRGLIRCFDPARTTPPIDLRKLCPTLYPQWLDLDPSGRLLCATSERGGVALNASTLEHPSQAACVASNGHYHHWRGRNPVPLNGFVALFGRPGLGRVELVDIRTGRVLLTLQSWGKDGWAAFTPDGTWTADDGGAARIVVYEGDAPLPPEQARKSRRPEAIEAVLAKLTSPRATPGR